MLDYVGDVFKGGSADVFQFGFVFHLPSVRVGISYPHRPELEIKLIQTRMIKKPLLWVEVVKVLVCLWGFVNCVSLRLLDMTRTRTRSNTNPYDTKEIAVGRSGCACGVQKARVCWGGVGRRGCRVALVCVLSLKPFGLPGVASFLCAVLPRRGLCAKHR
jgi:hypothetical protein